MSLTVSNARVASLLRQAIDLMSKGSEDGRLWTKGVERTSEPVVGSRHAFCSIGAIRNVEGFTDAERSAAERALAEMIAKSGDSIYHVEDIRTDYIGAADVITESNDSEDTRWEDVKGWFVAAARRLKS